MESLPEDMIEQILVALPVKSLLRFKCVGRKWCALIQSRRFIHRHHSREDRRIVFGLAEYARDEHLYDSGQWRFIEYDDYPWIGCRLGSVNGLLCEVSMHGHIVLSNPATHKVKKVPPPLPAFRYGDPHQFPDQDLIQIPKGTLGFGLDPLSGDYKIVAVFVGPNVSVYVYNSSNDCWKRIEVEGSCSVIKVVSYSRCLNAAFCNGTYYWVVLCEEDCVDIIGFDMVSDKFREIKFGEFKVQQRDRVDISAYGDSIALMWRRHGYGGELWVMGKQEIWSKTWTLEHYDYRKWPLCLWNNKVFFYDEDAYLLYDLSTEEVRRVEVEAPNQPMEYPPFSYQESLYWIKE